MRRSGFSLFASSLVTCCLLSLAACSSSGAGPALSAQGEAQREAEKYLLSQFTKCGDSYFRVLRIPGWKNIYSQVKEPTVVVKPEALTEADKLNGLQWSGIIYLTAKLNRSLGNELPHDQWSKWRDGADGTSSKHVGMRKEKGQWHFVDLRDAVGPRFGRRYIAVECSKMPPESGLSNGVDPNFEPLLPPRRSFVNDFAEVLDPATEEQLNRKLADVKARHDIDFVVITTETTDGMGVKSFTESVAKEWKLGPNEQGPQDRWIVLLLAVKDREYQIWPGNGGYPVVGEFNAYTIGSQLKEPFRQGQYGEVVVKAVDLAAEALAKPRR